MSCEAIWASDSIRIGDALAEEYRSRLVDERLLELALERGAGGEVGGAGAEETDRHFSWMFANSAGRSVYVCIDPRAELGDVSRLVSACLLDGELLLVDVPCGGGAGALGVISAIYEQRKAKVVPRLPLRVTVLAGDYSDRGREHFEAMAAQLAPHLRDQAIELELHTLHWDARDIYSSTAFIDRACDLAANKDRVFLLVNNFSGALTDAALNELFGHFLSQFTGRMRRIPNCVCWIEPNSKSANRMLPKLMAWFSRVFSRFVPPASGAHSSATYQVTDPLTSTVFGSGVSVLRADQGGTPW